MNLINDYQKKGKGIILLSGHYGNWELLAYCAGLFSGVPALIVVHPLKNPVIDKLLNRYRTRKGNQVVPMDNAAKAIVTTIRKGGVIALLADQSATYDKDIFVDFFGRPAATNEAPASLALRFDIPVLYAFSERQEDGTYWVNLKELKHDDLQNSPEDIREFTKRHVKALEEQIRKIPGQWAWQHRRWKHSHLSDENKNPE